MTNFIVIVGVMLATMHLANACRCVKPEKCDKVCGSDGISSNYTLDKMMFQSILHKYSNIDFLTGNTYNSECLLFCQSLLVPYCLTTAYIGPCKKPLCNCKEKCNYVCGSNGVKSRTYGNPCTLKCAQKFDHKLKFVKFGECGACDCSHAPHYPVCGSDSVTYVSRCDLECRAEVDLKLKEECEGECPCKSTYKQREMGFLLAINHFCFSSHVCFCFSSHNGISHLI